MQDFRGGERIVGVMQAVAAIISAAMFNGGVEQAIPVGVCISNPPAIVKRNIPVSPVIIRELFVALLAAILLISLPDCIAAAAGAGAGAVAYSYRNLESNLGEDYSKVVDAARLAIKELEFARVSENKDSLNAVLVARTELDKKVVITITNSGKKLTNIKIRVGLLGDEQLSIAILDKIKAGL
jgi:hypothetical protein